MSKNKNPFEMLKRQIIEIARQLRKEQTPSEKKLWQVLRNRKFLGLKFLRQHPIIFEIDGKTRFFIADFYCAEKKLVLEVDGGIHRHQIERDRERDSIIEKLGLKVLRIRNDEVRDIDLVLQKIKNFIESC